MKIKDKIILTVIILLCNLGYSSAQDFPLPGSGHGDATLQKDTYNAFSTALSEMLECPLDKVNITTEFEHYISATGQPTDKYEVAGERIATPWLEYWTANGCNNSLVLEVKYTPDPDPTTGTTYNIKVK